MPISIVSRKNLTFPKLHWSINKDETKELPEDEESQKIILASPYTRVLVITKDIKNPPESNEPNSSNKDHNQSKPSETGSNSDKKEEPASSTSQTDKSLKTHSKDKKEDK